MKLTEQIRQLQRLLSRRTEPSVEPISEDVTQTAYYHERSLVYATAQMVILLVLAVFLAVSFLSGSDRLSVENWTLFISDLSGSVVLPERGSTDTLVFPMDEENQFVSYRGGLALLGQNRLTVFTASGREKQSVAMQYHAPQLASSGKYLLAWDLGGRKIAAFHAFSRLFDLETDSPIRYVAASETGYFCVVTDDIAYASLVTLYDGDFDIVSRTHLKEYTVCAALSADGEQMALASLSTENGRLMLSVALSTPGEADILHTLTLPDAYPISMRYVGHSLQLICSDCVFTISREGELLSEYRFDAEEVLQARQSEYGTVLLMRANRYDGASRALVLASDGTAVTDVSVPYAVVDATVDETGCLYLLGERVLTVLEQGASEPRLALTLRDRYLRVLPRGDGEAYLCGEAKASCVAVD